MLDFLMYKTCWQCIILYWYPMQHATFPFFVQEWSKSIILHWRPMQNARFLIYLCKSAKNLTFCIDTQCKMLGFLPVQMLEMYHSCIDIQCEMLHFFVRHFVENMNFAVFTETSEYEWCMFFHGGWVWFFGQLGINAWNPSSALQMWLRKRLLVFECFGHVYLSPNGLV